MRLESPLARSTGARLLCLASAFYTAAILVWMLLLWTARGVDDLTETRVIHGLATIFFVLFARDDRGGAVCALVILVLAALLPAQARTRQFVRWVGKHPVPVALAACAAMAWGAVFIYRDHPLSMDEYAAWFQGQVFAAGHLSGKLPPPLLDWLIPPGFHDVFLNVSPAGDVTSSYWPSFSLLLAPFVWAGAPWLCNPIISALTLLVIHRMAVQLFQDQEAAGYATLLTVASPVLFADGISYYAMPAHLLANCLYALLLMQPTAGRAFLAGVVGSVALTLHNPVPHALFALPWLVWLALRTDRWKLLGPIIAGYLPLGLLLGVGWFLFSLQLTHASTGMATSPDVHAGLSHALSVFRLPTATVLLARVIGICKIWVWSVPGLMLLATVGAWQWRDNPACRLLAASAVLTLVGYVLVPVDQGHGWGYRYFHSAWMALPLLSAGAMYGQGAQPDRPAHSMFFGDGGVKTFVASCAVLSLILGVGYRAVQMREFISGNLSQVPDYFLSGPRIIVIDDSDGFYNAELVQNDPWLRGDVVRLYSHGDDETIVANVIRHNFPKALQVYSDDYGSVWTNPR